MRLKKDGTPAQKPGRKPKPQVAKIPKPKGRPRTRPIVEKGPRKSIKGKTYPDKWLSGSDVYKHSMYMPWLRAKAQANFRNEGWHLSFEEFYTLWEKDWNNRGRQPENMCMTRMDYQGEWTVANTAIITRKEHLVRQNFNRSIGIGKPTGRPRKNK